MIELLSKTKKYLLIGPYIIWFGLNTITCLLLINQFGFFSSLNYPVSFFLLGTLIIWHFGHVLFPLYLKQEGQFNRKLYAVAGINIALIALGISSHFWVPLLNGFSLPNPLGVRISIWCLLILLGMIMMASIRIAEVYHQRSIKEIGDEAEKAKAELQLLKNQISPHFLFNTLNNIYGLAYMKDDRAAKMISQLSKIMRYLLDQCEHSFVPITKERDLLGDYLSLQSLKYENSKNVDFYYSGLHLNHQIVPMILVNFVENCFKHSDLDHNPEGWIKIRMEVENDKLLFSTENTCSRKLSGIESKQGIGQKNSIKLLQANYPDKHELTIHEDSNIYHLNLLIEDL